MKPAVLIAVLILCLGLILPDDADARRGGGAYAVKVFRRTGKRPPSSFLGTAAAGAAGTMAGAYAYDAVEPRDEPVLNEESCERCRRPERERKELERRTGQGWRQER